MAFNITWQSKPLYDSFGWNDYWSCEDWITWFNALKDKYGKNQAINIWNNAWIDGLSGFAGGRAIAPGTSYINDSVPVECRSFNENFKAFLKQYPEINNVVRSGLAGFVTMPIGSAVTVTQDVINSVANATSDVASGLSGTFKVLKYALPIVLIATTIGFGVWGYKKYIK